jgi:N6-L-threonylcarbamoyladenine synthase
LKFILLGRTVDDAAGESFDKVAKMLGGGYPGGPFVEKLADEGNPRAIRFPIPMKDSVNFSFSGLKTSVLNQVSKDVFPKEDIAASFQFTVAATLAEKGVAAAKKSGHNLLVTAGGVAMNGVVRQVVSEHAYAAGIKPYFPDKALCNDNAAMIAYAAYRMASNDLSGYRRLDFKAGDTMHEISV